jgi:hypothetical protein
MEHGFGFVVFISQLGFLYEGISEECRMSSVESRTNRVQPCAACEWAEKEEERTSFGNFANFRFARSKLFIGVLFSCFDIGRDRAVIDLRLMLFRYTVQQRITATKKTIFMLGGEGPIPTSAYDVVEV